MKTVLPAFVVVSLLALLYVRFGHRLRPDNVSRAETLHGPLLHAALGRAGFELGAPVFIRIFKDSASLELWLGKGDRFELFKRYPICSMSGRLGPKTREGDRQAPEGAYLVSEGQLNPRSRFFLSFDLGYPNPVERRRGWTGSAIMVHGSCVSIGCFAVGDAAIAETYLLVRAALEQGQSAVPVHVFPFALTPRNLQRARDGEWLAFWKGLQPIYEFFETRHEIPPVVFDNGKYELACTRGCDGASADAKAVRLRHAVPKN